MSANIPTEVLEVFFRSVIRDRSCGGREKVTTILCVCRRWYNICLRLLWRNVVIRDHNQLLLFTDTPASDNFKLVRSLTISLDPPGPEVVPGFDSNSTFGDIPDDKLLESYDFIERNGNKATRRLWQALEQLPNHVWRLANVQTFSFTLRWPSYPIAPIGFWLQHHHIFDIVNCLPASIKALEIDTKCQERTRQSDKYCDVCTAIHRRMPHLEHVRLRLTRFCPNVFATSKTLKTMSLLLVQPIGCASDTMQCRDVDYIPSRRADEAREIGRNTRKHLVTTARETLANLPQLEKLLITEIEDHRDASMTLVVVRDVKADKTISMPFSVDYDRQMVHMRYRSFAENRDKDALGQVIELGEVAEGDTWVTTEEGSRFPTAYRDSAEGRGHQWSNKRGYETKEEFVANHNGNMIDLWKDEDEVGYPLLATKEMDGLGEVEPIFVEQTPAQREADEEEELEYGNSDDDDVSYDPFD